MAATTKTIFLCSSTSFFAVLVLALCHATAIYLFTTGFFLTRYSVDKVSACNLSSLSVLTPREVDIIREKFADDGDIGTSFSWKEYLKSGCWAPKKFSKSVVIVIDALRYDFLLYNESSKDLGFHRNKLPVFRDILRDEPKNAFIYKFMADPPTTTLQRIKGLTTGGLPTFIDAADNFDPSQNIKEDNIVDQIINQGSKIMFMGDDTWVSVYPDKFTKAHPYPSLVVKDLHTVDNGVIQHLFPYLKGERGEWNILLAHFLGVDHVGHTYGSDHPMMAPKLEQMNEVITKVKNQIDDETLMIVMGDHGMTWDGNHGGSSEEELSSAIFLYSKRPINNYRSIFGKSTLEEGDMLKISQVDFTPTMSFLLGAPIPYGNLGQVVPELFSNLDLRTLPHTATLSEYDRNIIIPGLKSLTLYRYINAAQIFGYLLHYSNKTRQFPPEFLHELEHRFLELRTSFNDVNLWKDIEKLQKFQEKFESFYSYAIDMCHKLWTSFDEPKMIKGGLTMLISLFITAFLISQRDLSPLKIIYSILFGGFTCVALLMAKFQIEDGVLVGWILFSTTAFIQRRPTLIEAFKSMEFEDMVLAVIFTLRAAGLGGNSYIEAEDKVLRHMLTTVGLLILLRIMRRSKNDFIVNVKSVLLIMTATSALFYATGGRHETIEISEDLAAALELIGPWLLLLFSYSSLSSSIKSSLMNCLAFPILAIGFRVVVGPGRASAAIDVICSVSSLWFLINRSYLTFGSDSSNQSKSLKLLNMAQSVFMMGYWSASALGILGDLHSPDYFSFFFRIVLPDGVYLCSITSLLFLGINYFQGRVSSGSVLIDILIGLYPSFSLLLGRRSIFGFFLLFFIAKNLRTISPKLSELMLAMFLSLLCDLFFYKTGHKPDFSALHFQSPYIGFDHYNFLLGGFVLITNTFVSQIFLPMILLSATDAKSSRSFLYYIGCHSIIVAMSMLSTGINRRHLMVWRVFAPKYIFDASGLLVIDAILTFILLLTSAS